MKWISIFQKGIIFMLLASSALGKTSPTSTEQKLKAIMQKPLIIGASISADRISQSPAKKLALDYTKLDQIKKITRNGSGGFKILKDLHSVDLSDRTVILALDLFFWDSTLKSSLDLSFEQMDRLIHMADQRGIPLVLGEVPDLLPGFQPARQQLNDAIAKKCFMSKQCHMLALDSHLRRLRQDGYLTFAGKRFRLAELIPDGLHLSASASEFLAAELKALLVSKI